MKGGGVWSTVQGTQGKMEEGLQAVQRSRRKPWPPRGCGETGSDVQEGKGLVVSAQGLGQVMVQAQGGVETGRKELTGETIRR